MQIDVKTSIYSRNDGLHFYRRPFEIRPFFKRMASIVARRKKENGKFKGHALYSPPHEKYWISNPAHTNCDRHHLMKFLLKRFHLRPVNVMLDTQSTI